MRTVGIIAAAFALLAGAATARTPAFDPALFKKNVTGPRTQVFVLGTPHLSGLPKTFKLAYLTPLLDRLARYRPDIITIEGLSGPSCDALVRYKAIYPDVAETYCASTKEAEAATGLSRPAAEAEVQRILAAWPAAPSAGQRRHLAAVFAAAGDRASAMMQWLRLAPAERRPGDGIDAPLMAYIEGALTRANESYQIAATLAARLGLERVYLTDDHSADSIVATLGPGYEKALTALWSAPNSLVETLKAREAALRDGEQTLAYYRFVNLPASQMAAISGDFGAALKQQSPELYGRQYVAWWEVRNLRMVANIRAAFGNHPGARVLSVVGSSHKAYFDAYLNLMHEVDLVDAEAVLK